MLSMCRNSLQLLLLLLFSHTLRSTPTYSHVTHIWAMWSWSIPGLAVVEGWRIPSTTPGQTVSAHPCWGNCMVRRGSTTGHSDPWNTNDHVRKRSEENGQTGYWGDGRETETQLTSWSTGGMDICSRKGSNTLLTRWLVGICPYECIDRICKQKCRRIPAADLLYQTC